VNQKGLAPILIVLAVVVLISITGGTYYLGRINTTQPSITKSTDETVNWKTYTSDLYNPFYTDDQLRAEIERQKSLPGGNPKGQSLQKISFSIMYPPDWVQGFDDGSDQTIRGPRYGRGFTLSKGDYIIKVHEGIGPPGGNLCSAYPTYNQDFKNIQGFVKMGRINSSLATTSYFYKSGFTEYTICTSEYGPVDSLGDISSIGKITYSVPNNTSDADLATMDKIISTLTFPKQNQSTATTDTSSWKIFTSALGGFIVKYPPNWITQGFEGYKESFSQNSDIIRFYSKNLPRDFTNGNYMCVEFRIGSADNYLLKNGDIIDTLQGGLTVYQEKGSVAGKDYYHWQLTKSDKKMSSVDLPNGNRLLATAEYNCIQGDLGNINLNLDQQANSIEFKQALKILESIQYQQSNQLSDVCTQEIQSISTVVTSFEGQQKLRQADWILSMFTPAQTQAEISDYNYLSGKDANISPRLYSNVSTSFNTNSYRILNGPTKYNDNYCSVIVQEERSYYGGPANPQYLPATSAGFTFVLVKQNGSWKIDKYQNQTGKSSGESNKYSGWF